MIKVCFLCHGNICRSTMAEFVFKDFVEKKGLADKFFICSKALHNDEIGSPVHYGTARVLDRLGIDYSKKRAEKVYSTHYDEFDYIIGMDEYNRRDMNRLFGHDKDGKCSLLLDYTDHPRSVADPWYTGDFETTYRDVVDGINAFYEFLIKDGKL